VIKIFESGRPNMPLDVSDFEEVTWKKVSKLFTNN
jgi:hypothetical protein